MDLLKLIEEKAEVILGELKARCEQLRNAYDKNAHAHIDPVVDALQAHVDAKAEPVVETVTPVETPVVAPVNTEQNVN